MSNSDNPFSAPTTVAEPVLKSPAPKRGVAHIVRRGKPSGSPPPAVQGSVKSPPAKAGKAHVIARNAPTHLADDSIDQLITSPALQTPQKPAEPIPEPRGKKAVASAGQSTVRGGGPLGTGSIDELTVEEGQPQLPKAMVAIADALEVAPANDPARGFLAVRSGVDLGRRVGLLEGRTTIGRGLECDIVLCDPTISKQHAYVERRENVYVVCDLGSGNGTFVNERERQEEVLIVNGDSFRLGNSVLSFEGPEAQDDAGSTDSWASAAVGGKKAGRSRHITSDEESTVAGKGRHIPQNAPTHLDDEPVTEAPTGVVESVQVAPEPRKPKPPKRTKRKKTVPPPIPEDKKSVQDAALAALSSIVNTPTPELIANQTGLGELPNQTVPPTPSPAILYPINGPNSAPVPSAPPPLNLAQAPMQMAPQGQMRPPQGQRQIAPTGPPPPMPGYQGASAPMHMRQGPQGQMPMGPAGPPMPGYRQPSAPQMQRPMLPGSGQDMMRPSYSAGNPSPRENGKLLIGFISVTLVLVVVGLLATVIGQMDDGKDGEPTNESMVAAPGPDAGDDTPVPVIDDQKDIPPDDPKDIPPDDPKDPKDIPPDIPKDDPPKDEPDSKLPDTVDPSVFDSKDEPPKDEPPKDEPPKDEPPTNGKQPLRLDSLTTGKTTLALSAWGTDETFLSSMTKIEPTVVNIPEDPPDPGTTVTDPPKDDPPKVDPPKDDPPKDDPPKNDRNNRDKNNRDKNNRDKNNRDKNNRDKNNRDKNNRDKNNRDKNNRGNPRDPNDDTPKGGSSAERTARSQAKSMYKKYQFDTAARRLFKAADNLPDDSSSAEDLIALAEAYQDVGAAYTKGSSKKKSRDYRGALSDFKKALSLDKKAAGGALSTLLRLRIGEVAPNAAKSYMSDKKYKEAKKAAGDAKRNNAGGEVASVYASLEKYANKKIKKALRAKKNGDDDEAKDFLKEAIDIAPKRSDAEAKAKSELKKL